MSWRWFSFHGIQSLCLHACRHAQLFLYSYHCLTKDFLSFGQSQSNLAEITDLRATGYMETEMEKDDSCLCKVSYMQLMDTKQFSSQLRFLFWVDFHVFVEAQIYSIQISDFCILRFFSHLSCFDCLVVINIVCKLHLLV